MMRPAQPEKLTAAPHRPPSQDLPDPRANWSDYQRNMTAFLGAGTSQSYIRALRSYGWWCWTFDPDSADRNIAEFKRIHGERFAGVD